MRYLIPLLLLLSCGLIGCSTNNTQQQLGTSVSVSSGQLSSYIYFKLSSYIYFKEAKANGINPVTVYQVVVNGKYIGEYNSSSKDYLSLLEGDRVDYLFKTKYNKYYQMMHLTATGTQILTPEFNFENNRFDYEIRNQDQKLSNTIITTGDTTFEIIINKSEDSKFNKIMCQYNVRDIEEIRFYNQIQDGPDTIIETLNSPNYKFTYPYEFKGELFNIYIQPRAGSVWDESIVYCTFYDNDFYIIDDVIRYSAQNYKYLKDVGMKNIDFNLTIRRE